MGFISWVVLGLIVGVLAKLFMPGKGPGGLVFTVLLGIAGSFVGGYLGSILGISTRGGVNLGSIAMATAGAVLLLFIYRKAKS